MRISKTTITAAPCSSYKVSVQTVEAVPGVRIILWLGLLVAYVVHDFVLSLSRNLQEFHYHRVNH